MPNRFSIERLRQRAKIAADGREPIDVFLVTRDRIRIGSIASDRLDRHH